MNLARAVALSLLAATPALAQNTTNNPFPTPIEAVQDLVVVNYVEFASLPDVDGDPARAMTMTHVSGTDRLFVSDMRGILYWIDLEGDRVVEYLKLDDPRWPLGVEAGARERGLQSFAFHPQFNLPGTPGYGRFYTYTDVQDTGPVPDFTPGGGNDTHDTVLHEWRARDAGAEQYDGDAPREMIRFEQPFSNHNGGHLGFDPTAAQGDADYGLLYIGVADGGSGGDPLNVSQNMGNAFGKVFRIDPLGSNSENGEYGIPADNPFVDRSGVVPEIYASGVRNPQRFAWDPANGSLYLADIGQNIVEELSPVTAGANLGWNSWEGSFRFISRSEVSLDYVRGDPTMTYPIAEYDQQDPLLIRSSAITGVHVFRNGPIPALEGRIMFGDMPSGEIFHVSADILPAGGQDAIRRVLFNDRGEARTLLDLVRATNLAQGREPAERTDMRFGNGPEGELFITNKHDGVIRLLVP